ncbi:Cyclin-U4-1 [Hondaea fermentalgiana]|uniref:Cyclin-U4-1 n=1 Tax=Hondaea fermentalgiana TaxID=2315210 RepID=A0A2R5GXX5_9STRA|nr:Cyclin-U4-1 [Hondaea fermentalgiana]|eukprot:GBG34648.1 Cyclin-U4-1 [Hondaea fermentalgiana]
MAPFEGYNVPRLSLGWYLWRIVYFLNKYPRVEATFFAEEEGHIAADFSPGQHMPASHERARDMEAVSRGLRSLLLALVYVDRVGQRYPDSPVTSRSLHRIMLTAIFVATKFSDDFSVGAETFARVGGLTVKELLRMEGAFCALIGFNLHVTDREFDAKCLPQLDAAFDIAAQRARAGVARSHGTPPHVQYGASSLKGNDATRAGSHPGQLLARASDPERPPSRGLAPPPA